MISFGPLDPERETDRLIEASAAEFGAEGYQQMRRYLDWLYRANPAGRGYADCLVARRGEAIVGAIHRMQLPLTGPDGALSLAVLHNHFVADDIRSGPGVLLLRRAVKDVDIGFAPGVQAPLDGIYRRLGFAEQPGWWLVRPLRPFLAAWQAARARLGGGGSLRVDLARLAACAAPLRVTGEPDTGELTRVAEAMRVAAPGEARVDWTPALLRWRYFDPNGPRHLLVSDSTGSAMAVVALGRRRGVATARVLELFDADARFVRRLHRLLRRAGAAVGLSFTADPAVADLLKGAGWRVRGNGTFSFRGGPVPLAVSPGATDVGFEAFRTMFR